MNRRTVLLGLFGVLALAQIAVPVSMVVEREMVLRYGRVLKFRTAPVDPFDALRGRYMALRFESNSVPEPTGIESVSGQRVYALVEEDADGFARFTGLSARRPEGDAYMQVRVDHSYHRETTLALPFDRYYLEEDLAPAAEEAYRARSARGSHDAYVTVRVWKGRAVLEELYVGGKPILEFLKQPR
ncbi:MAG: GDYXXLXY domain-containing protein [Planctomycetes bacterium]|nr:GDYXXLXY domain-containing protein [Planctomycetota bacterium]